jgi:hypothetical protein
MMSTIINTGFDTTTNKDLYKKGSLRQIFDSTLYEPEVFYKEIVNDKKTDLLTERDLHMAGFEAAAEVTEGQNIPIFSPALDVTKEYTQRDFGIGFRMTYKANYFNQYDLWARWAKQAARKQVEAKDIEIHTMFNNPTSTSLTAGTGFDSLAMASNTHTGLLSGSTDDNYDNYLNQALSLSALESARYYFRTLKDAMGVYRGTKATHLVFEPTLYYTAHEILGSSGKPFEMSNTKNVYPQSFGGLKPYEDPRLTSTTMWFLIAKEPDLYDFNVFTAMNPKLIVKQSSDRTLDKEALSLQYFTYGWGWPGAYYLGKA